MKCSSEVVVKERSDRKYDNDDRSFMYHGRRDDIDVVTKIRKEKK